MEDRAFSRDAIDPDRPTLASDKLGGDIEPQSQPGIVIDLIVLCPEELLEDLLLCLFGDTDAEVFHAYRHVLVVCSGANDDFIGIGRIFDGIGKEISDHLPRSFSIGQDKPCYPEARSEGLFLLVLLRFIYNTS